jgi:hypothetical protein
MGQVLEGLGSLVSYEMARRGFRDVHIVESARVLNT